MKRTCSRFSVLASLLVWAIRAGSQTAVLTYHNDNARTGLNATETTLTVSNVNAAQFGKLFSQPVDGQIYAQPLVVPGVSIPGQGVHNFVIVATENNSVYAFDANSASGANGTPLWQANLGTAALSSHFHDYKNQADGMYHDLVPEMGITGTPVIDPTSNTLYVVAFTEDTLQAQAVSYVYHQWLHALDVATGAERPGSPVEILGQVPGFGYDSVAGAIPFRPGQQLQRPGLALWNGIVYIAFASHADADPYHGWLMGYNGVTLNQVATYCTTANGSEAGIWMSGAAPALGGSGHIYLATANDDFGSFNPSAGNYSESFLKLSTDSGLTLVDYFTPYNWSNLDATDADLGSGGVVVLPDSVGSAANPNLLVGAGKQGTIYLLSRDNLGQFHPDGDYVVQTLPGAITMAFCTPAFFYDRIFYCGNGDVMKAFEFANGQFYPPYAMDFTDWSHPFDYPGATPSVSANGTGDPYNGIVWIIENVSGSQTDHSQPGKAVLHAYRTSDLSTELYNSSQAPNGRDDPGNYVKFSVPTIANGHVYVGTANSLVVYGLL